MKKLLLMLSLAALPAAAQDTPLGSRIRQPTAVVPGDLRNMDQRLVGRLVMDQFGRCLLSTRPVVAQTIMSRSPLGDDLWAQITKNNDLGDCLTTGGMSNVTLTMQMTALRGAVFKAAYSRDHAAVPAMMPAKGSDGTPPAQPDWLADVTTPGTAPDAAATAYAGLRQLAACVVLNKTDAVHRTLLARPGSDAEASAIAEFMPAVAGCIPDGQELALTKIVLVGALAEVAQRLAVTK
jgi:hypothetical protein